MIRRIATALALALALPAVAQDYPNNDPLLLAASGEHRYEDIAALLRVPLGTVKWRMLEARRVLRDKLTRLGFGDAL